MIRKQKPPKGDAQFRVQISDKQQPPIGDARYRVHRSVKCYVAEMVCGTKWCTWDFRDSIERVVYLSPRGIENVIYKNVYYELRPPEEMEEVIRRHLADKGAVNISGKSLHYRQSDQTFDAYPFIDITDNKTRERYRQLRDGWLRSDDYKNA